MITEIKYLRITSYENTSLCNTVVIAKIYIDDPST